MTQEDLETYLTEWAMDYCHNDFSSGIPAGVKIFIDKASAYMLKQAGITSESLGDYSVSMNPDFPAAIMNLLTPYRKIKML